MKIIDFTEYLDDLLAICRGGAQLDSLVNCLNEYTDSHEEALDFIHQLIDSQILVSEMEIATTGERADLNLISLLKEVKIRMQDPIHIAYVQFLITNIERILAELCKIDNKSGYDRSSAVDKILEILDSLNLSLNKKNLVQTDLKIKLIDDILGTDVINLVEEGIRVLSKISPSRRTNEELKAFKEKFLSRYEEREIPLVEALDIESGIGYGDFNDTIDNSFLVDNLFREFKPDLNPTSELTWQNELHKSLTNKIIHSIKCGTDTIELLDEDISKMNEKDELFHSTYTAVISLINSGKETKIVLNSVNGPTASSWLGRFCFIDNDVAKLVQDISDSEKNANPDIIVAEVTHLPENRLGNVLQRPSMRDFEIPYLSKSNLPLENQINVNDLFISVRNDKVILRSKKYNKIVLPYISNALNYKFRGLPIFTFLGDLQQHNAIGGHYLDIGPLNDIFDNIPRIVYKNIVLRRASWTIDRKSIEYFLKLTDDELVNEWLSFSMLRKFPSRFSVKISDNELVFSSKSLVSLKVFFNEVKNNTQIVIREAFIDKTDSVKDLQGNYYNNEILLLFENGLAKSPSPITFPIKKEHDIKRDLIIGSECLYFKIYLGYKQSDAILLDLSPLLNNLFSSGKITKWFFIRYKDSGNHLRVRVFVSKDNYDNVYQIISQKFSQYYQNKQVENIIQDTYKREIERYGDKSILPIENFFCIDSQIISQIIYRIEELAPENKEELRWIISIYLTNIYIQCYNLSNKEIIDFAQSNHKFFVDEFSISKNSLTTLDQEYSKRKKHWNHY